MPDTLYSFKLTTITSPWLNEVNNFVYKGRDPNYTVSTGAVNAYVLTLPTTSLFAGPQNGDTFKFKSHQVNTGAATLTVQNPVNGFSTGPLPILYGAVALAGSEMAGVIEVVFDSGAWHLQENASFAPKNSPVFSGIPQVPTAPAGTNNSQIASTAYTDAAVATVNVINAAIFSGFIAQGAGTSDAITASFSPAITSLGSGTPVLLVRATASNTTSTPTFTPNASAISPAVIQKWNNAALNVGDIYGAGMWIQLKWDVGTGAWELLNPANPTLPRAYLAGLGMSNVGTSHTMAIAAGQAVDSTNTVLMNFPSSFQKTTSAWAAGNAQGGLDTGSISNSTWYYFFLIQKSDKTTDIIFSLSSSAPTLPAGYTYFRYIGGGLVDSGGNWTLFTQVGDYFTWGTPVLDYNGAGSTTGASLTLTVPRGRKVRASMNANGGVGGQALYLSDLSNANLAPSYTATPLGQITGTSTTTGVFSVEGVWTDTSATIRVRSSGGSTIVIATTGWLDLRDKNL